MWTSSPTGRMRRWYFVQGFYSHFSGLESRDPLRKVGIDGYDSPPRYRPVERVTVPNGLGIVEEFAHSRQQTDHALKMTCPGPLTLTIHIQTRRGDVYDGDRLALAYDVAGAINRELHALADAGATFIQLDEPSYSIIPGEAQEWVELYNTTVKGVRERGVKLGLHVCFGNLGSRPRGKRTYRWMFPRPARHRLRRNRPGVRQPRDARGGPARRDRPGSRDRRRPRGREVVLRRDAGGRSGADTRGASILPAGEDDRRSRLRVLPASPLAGLPEAPATGAGRRDRPSGADRRAELASPGAHREGALYRIQALVIPACAGIHVPLPQRGGHRGAVPGRRLSMATTMTKLLTADDLLRLDSEGVRGELIRGVLHETMPAGYAPR